jgi:hypothetical protein
LKAPYPDRRCTNVFIRLASIAGKKFHARYATCSNLGTIMSPQAVIAKEVARRSYIMAIGCGSRKKGYDGNKTLPPLEPGPIPNEGGRFHPVLPD